MAERLTMTSDKGGVALTFDLDITCRPSEAQKILKLAEKLKYYEDLEEQGRMVILPENEEKVQAMNEKLLELTDIAEAALKGAEE